MAVARFASLLVTLVLFTARAGATPRSEKRVAVEQMLSRGVLVLVLDTRRPGVVVPPHHLGDAKMLLAVDLKDKPIIDDTGVTVALTEKGKTTQVVVPWSAIYRAVTADDKETFWNADTPNDLKDNFVDPIEAVITTEPKRAALENMLDIRETRIYIDARRPRVVVPCTARRSERDITGRAGPDRAPRAVSTARLVGVTCASSG